MAVVPRPFLKWPGGKGQLLQYLEPSFATRPGCLRDSQGSYFEPFVGGGAVFFWLLREGHLKSGRAVLNDSNMELMDTYRAVKSDVLRLLRALRSHERKHCETYFYKVRASKPRSLVQKAARTIYLNKTCFNGLYRTNRQGQFNAPYGDYKKPLIVDRENLLACSEALQNVLLFHGDFELVCRMADQGDTVYLDPPYLPLNKQSFTRYDRLPFDLEAHRRLAEVFSSLKKRGVHVVLTNSKTDDTYRLYDQHNKRLVPSRRSINRDGVGRGAVADVVVT